MHENSNIKDKKIPQINMIIYKLILMIIFVRRTFIQRCIILLLKNETPSESYTFVILIHG